MHSLVVANGELSVPSHILNKIQDAELVIAVDGGLKYCQELGLQPDLLIGDLDSSNADEIKVLQSSGADILRFPPTKDETDLELALLQAVERGALEITVIGALGRRFDMTLANLGLLLHPDLRKVKLVFWHYNQRIWLIQPPGGEILGQDGDTLSLLPFAGIASGIHTENLAYPLSGETLFPGPARGISNVLTDEKARVTLEKGCLLAVWTQGRA